MSKFEQQVRDYFSKHRGIEFYSTDFGFFTWSISRVEDEVHFWCEEMYIEPEHASIKNFLVFTKQAYVLAYKNKCTHILFTLNRDTDNYAKKRRVAENSFGFECIGTKNNLDIFARSINEE